MFYILYYITFYIPDRWYSNNNLSLNGLFFNSFLPFFKYFTEKYSADEG